MAEKDELTRFGVSFPIPLIEQFDRYIDDQGYSNRSEAFRDLVRKTMLETSELHLEQLVAGTIVMVYDHHVSELPNMLMELQHNYHHDIISTMHVHLNHDQCMEIIVVRGQLSRLRTLQQKIKVEKGILYAELSVTYIEGLNSEGEHHEHHHS